MPTSTGTSTVSPSKPHPIKSYFPNPAAEFTYVRTYAKWIEEKIRREYWPETVDRYINFIHDETPPGVPPKVFRKIKNAMLRLAVMPSMRALWSAGEAAKRQNLCFYNCAFLVVDCIESFSECLYILMCGTGAGFSVEKKYIERLPEVIPFRQYGDKKKHSIADNKEGWADSVKILMSSLYSGHDVDMDYSELRPRGARLKTTGGRSSGPEPLVSLHEFIRNTFQNAQGRKLTSLECHDIMNQIAEIVVVGGVRRSAEASLSDLDDEEMANAKNWPFPLRRSMANNSAVYIKKPTATDFLKEWSILASSGTGERGIFNLEAARIQSPSRRNQELIVGSNPCYEILLRSNQLCNLSEVIIRPDDDVLTLLDKIETATWIGVIQSTFTNFPYLRDIWKKNCDEERLLGVSLTGQMDNPDILTPDVMGALKAKAKKVAKHAAEKLGINMPAAITCIKPSGTVAQVVDCASGAHPRYSQYYVRRYRISAMDPLYKMLRDQGVSMSPETGQRQCDWDKGNIDDCSIYEEGEPWSENKVRTWIVSFPVKSPAKCITRDQMSAIEQLEWYKRLQQKYCEHNVSLTVYVKDHEWFEVGNWVYSNWYVISGVSFLPHGNGNYEQPPYEEISAVEYAQLVEDMIEIDYTKLSEYEMQDNTEGEKTYSCGGNACEIT